MLPASVLLAIGLTATPAAADTGRDTGEDTGSKDADLQVCLCAVVDGGAAAATLAGAALLAATRRRQRGTPIAREDAIDTVLARGVLPDDVARALHKKTR